MSYLKYVNGFIVGHSMLNVWQCCWMCDNKRVECQHSMALSHNQQQTYCWMFDNHIDCRVINNKDLVEGKKI